jgi:DNA-binding MarR family transcriptional regulator
MTKDSVQPEEEQWGDLAEVVETAAQFRRLFPRNGFESLNTSQLQVLLAVAVWPDLTHGQLAECLAMEKNSVSQPLNELESAGLAAITVDPSDRRIKTSRLTPAGIRLAERYREVLTSTDSSLEP